MTTKAEREWMEKITEHGCLLSFTGQCGGVLELHHITRAGRRIDHLHTLPFCTYHSGPQTPLPIGEAVHKGKKIFEKKYGSQFALLKKLREQLNHGENHV